MRMLTLEAVEAEVEAGVVRHLQMEERAEGGFAMDHAWVEEPLLSVEEGEVVVVVVAGDRWLAAGDVAEDRWLVAGDVAEVCWLMAEVEEVVEAHLLLAEEVVVVVVDRW